MEIGKVKSCLLLINKRKFGIRMSFDSKANYILSLVYQNNFEIHESIQNRGERIVSYFVLDRYQVYTNIIFPKTKKDLVVLSRQ